MLIFVVKFNLKSKFHECLVCPLQCCCNMVAWSPNPTHESTGWPKVPPWMVHLATNEFLVLQKIFRNESGHKFPPMHWYHVSGGTCVKVKGTIRLAHSDQFLINFMVWADYWLTDHPELGQTTQASTMGAVVHWVNQDFAFSTALPLKRLHTVKSLDIRRIKSQNLSDSRPVVQLSLPNLLKPCVKSRMRM